MSNKTFYLLIIAMATTAIIFTSPCLAEEPAVSGKQPVKKTQSATGVSNAKQLLKQGERYYDARDYKQAVSCYRKAAELGLAEAQTALGSCYELGQGVQQDYKQARYWLSKAAEQGDAFAQGRIGYFYMCGKGVERDRERGVYWTRKAADQGDPYGCLQLGLFYYYGLGVTKDEAKGIELFRTAARKGEKEAQAMLKELGLSW